MNRGGMGSVSPVKPHHITPPPVLNPCPKNTCRFRVRQQLASNLRGSPSCAHILDATAVLWAHITLLVPVIETDAKG